MDKNWYLYIVQCNDRTFYTGITDNLERRIEEHNLGKGAKYTRGRGPVRLCYHKEFLSKSDALKEEYRIKQLSRSEKAALCNQFVPEGKEQN